MIRFGSLVAAFLVTGMANWSISDRPGRDPLDVRILDAAVLAFAFLALTVLLFGTIGMLDWWMLVVTAGMSASMWAMIDGRTGLDARAEGSGKLGIGFISSLALALGAFAVVQAVLGRAFRPPVGDPLAYHLPFAVEWLQRQTLDMPVPAAGDPSTTFYPLNSSAWIFWLLAPFESEILARFVQLPFLFLLGLAVFRVGRELRLSSGAAATSAALVVTVPSIARSASLPENDLILAAFLLTATAFLMRLGRDFTVWRAGMTALVIGLAIGTKVIALAFGGVLGLIWIVITVRARWPNGFWSVVRILSAGAVIVAVVGGYSYLRNAVMMENPLYPAGYDLPGGYVLEGLYFPTWEWRQNHAFFAFDWSSFLNGSRRDFGWTVTAWAIPGVVLAGLVLLVRLLLPGRSRRDLQGLIPILWVAGGMAIFWYIVPYHFTRFLFATIAMAILAGMWALGRSVGSIQSLRIASWYPLLALPVIGLNLINVPIDLAIRERSIYWVAGALVIGGTLAGLYVARSMPARRIRLVVQMTSMVVLMIAITAWPFVREEYDDRRQAEWRAQVQGFSQTPDAWEWIDQETRGAPAVIAIAGTNEIYPFFGPDLENRILTIWSSGDLAKYGWGEVFRYAGEPEQGAWEGQINDSEVDYVILTEDVSFGGWPEERSWMASSPERYGLVFANDEIEIWEVSEIVARYTVR